MRPSPRHTEKIREVLAVPNAKGWCSPASMLCWSEKAVRSRPKRCKLAHAFLWEYSDKGLKMAQLLGQHGVSLASG